MSGPRRDQCSCILICILLLHPSPGGSQCNVVGCLNWLDNIREEAIRHGDNIMVTPSCIQLPLFGCYFVGSPVVLFCCPVSCPDPPLTEVVVKLIVFGCYDPMFGWVVDGCYGSCGTTVPGCNAGNLKIWPVKAGEFKMGHNQISYFAHLDDFDSMRID